MPFLRTKGFCDPVCQVTETRLNELVTDTLFYHLLKLREPVLLENLIITTSV
jgi:hypothetical protein